MPKSKKPKRAARKPAARKPLSPATLTRLRRRLLLVVPKEPGPVYPTD